MLDEIEKDEELEGVEDTEDIDDDEILSGKKKGKKVVSADESLDDMAEDEDIDLPEDSYDDVDLW